MPVPSLAGAPVLVTGGAGFIGSHLVDRLVRLGARVRVLDDLSTGKKANLESSWSAIELIEGDIRDLEACRRAALGMVYVFHQAARGSVPRSMKHPEVTMDVNVTGMANVLSACRDAGTKRIVYASSSSVYGDSERIPKVEGQEGRPLSPYGLSKVMNEQLADVFGRCYGMELVGLRYFNVYGPRQDPDGPYAAVVPRFCAAARKDEPLLIDGDGEQSRDFTHVEDAVTANLLAAGAAREATGRAYNVAPGRRTTVNELASIIVKAFSSRSLCRHEAPRPGDVRHSLADGSAARASLGTGSYLPLEEGIARLVDR